MRCKLCSSSFFPHFSHAMHFIWHRQPVLTPASQNACCYKMLQNVTMSHCQDHMFTHTNRFRWLLWVRLCYTWSHPHAPTMKCVKISFWCKFAIYWLPLSIYWKSWGILWSVWNFFCDGEQLSIYCLVRCRKPCCVARDASLQLKGCRLKMPNEWTRTAKCHRLKVFPSFFIFHLAPFQLFSITSVESTGQQSGSDSASN